MKWPRLRFSLFALLGLTAAICISLWAVPAWQERQRRMEFEAAATQLAGGINDPLFESLPDHAHGGTIGRSLFYDAEGVPVEASFFRYKSYWYCIYVEAREITDDERKVLIQAMGKFVSRQRLSRLNLVRYFEKVEVYRLKPPPKSYAAQTVRGKQKIRRHSDSTLAEKTPSEQYETDFLQIISGLEDSDLGIEYELIHQATP